MQVDHRLACELLSQVEDLPIFLVIEVETFRDFLTGVAILCQLQPLASVTVTRVAAHGVYTHAPTFVLLTLVYVCPTYNIYTYTLLFFRLFAVNNCLPMDYFGFLLNQVQQHHSWSAGINAQNGMKE